MSQSPLTARSPLAVVYLLHIALEIPVAVQGMWMPYALPFLEMNNTSLVLLKVCVRKASAGVLVLTRSPAILFSAARLVHCCAPVLHLTR
jgi:hypothetical protein